MKKSKGKRERLKWERDLRARMPKKEVVVLNSKTKEIVNVKAFQNEYKEIYFACDGSVIPKNFEVAE